jgi:O-acetylhomoserine/O-acetylserine sulfhydrylase-like pyridoxal-dependent enzyme
MGSFQIFYILKGYEYTRSGNPTRKVLEDTLAALDKGKYGEVSYQACFSM